MTGVDCLIRGGSVMDGLGSQAIVADVAIADGRIAAVGPDLAVQAKRIIDAAGCLVTPGFVDMHTHFDGQATWSDHLDPSSAHGVTTAIMGNCGVGFAPCRQQDHAAMIAVMEGVEDIPGIVMDVGLAWNWSTFPDYLDALDARARDINVAAYVPHAALRVFVMGERGLRREAATPDDLARMAALVEEALRAGALGVSTASVPVHRTSTGEFTPTYEVAETELLALAGAVRRVGRGILQVLVDFSKGAPEDQIDLLARLSQAAGSLVTFTLTQSNGEPRRYAQILELIEKANAQPGVKLVAQVFSRPIGLLLGHTVTFNPFRLCPSYRPLADLPLADKVAALRDPALRARLLAETPADPTQPNFLMARRFERIYPLGNPPVYEPAPGTSIADRARAAGVSPETIAYDLMLEEDGQALLLAALANFPDGNLDATAEMLAHPHCLPGLGDGGAHYGMICDSTFTTYLLTHWVRDRAGPRLPLPEVIADLTSRPAALLGLTDRGVLKPGYRADINVIDPDRLALGRPTVVADLPAGGKRIVQPATGYVATLVAGAVIAEQGHYSGELPGGLIRDAGLRP